MKAHLFVLFFSLNVFAFSNSNVGTEFSVFHQPGSRFSNQGYASELTGEQILSSGFSIKEKVGYEHFIGDGTGTHHGVRALVSGMYPVSRTAEVNAAVGYRSLGRNWGDYELATAFDSKEEDFELGLGFERSFVMDSYFAYVGASQGDVNMGASRLHEFYSAMTWNEGVLRYRLRPSLGWITAGTLPSNFKGGVNGSAELLMIQEDVFDLDLIYETRFIHYQLDQSGTVPSNYEPYAGGYFSPRLFLEQFPHIAMKYRPQNSMELSFLIGPSLQVVREFQKGSMFGIGAVSSLGFDFRMNQIASLKTELSYASLAGEFGRFQSSLGLAYNL